MVRDEVSLLFKTKRFIAIWFTLGACEVCRHIFPPIYVETSVRNKCRCSFYCALLTIHVSAPIGCHLQVVCNTKNSKAVTVYVNGSVASVRTKANAVVSIDPLTYTVTAFEFFVLQTSCFSTYKGKCRSQHRSVDIYGNCLRIFCITNHLKMATNRGRNM
jgi:hypothetical protein